MLKFSAHPSGKRTLPLTRQSLENYIAVEQRKTIFFLKVQTTALLSLAVVIFAISAVILGLYFYTAPVSFSKRGWVHVRNLTPVVGVETHVSGALEQVFASPGQLVQKGELLAAVQTGSIKLDYEKARRDFADKIVELHCLASLQHNRSAFKLPYDAQLLVDQIEGEFDVLYRVEQCERELLRNVIADQSLEETIAAFEDQVRLLENVVKIRGAIKNTAGSSVIIELDIAEDFTFPFGDDQTALREAYRDQYFPMMQLAQVKQELHKTRKEYFLRKLQKEKELDIAIEQTTDEMRYLNKRLRELNKQLENNFIYASITGTIIGSTVPKTGTYYKEHEAVFKLQPIDNEFQISIALDEEDSDRFTIGTPTMVSFGQQQENYKPLMATTIAVLRNPGGTLEAILNLKGNAKRNAEIILASGYRGEGAQRLPANIITGQSMAWQSIRDIIFRKATNGSI